MTCEEFAIAGLDLGEAEQDSLAERAARVHMKECAHCAALHENWLALRGDLRELGKETAQAAAPARVEMRLLQEFHTKHKTVRGHRAAMVVGWTLATAATVILAVTSVLWHERQVRDTGSPVSQTTNSPAAANLPVEESSASGLDTGSSLIAANNTGDFTALPDSMPPISGDATVVRVEMQRAALGELGLTVNEEHAADWIQVDLLVGDDGLPQAVRLPQSTAGTTK